MANELANEPQAELYRTLRDSSRTQETAAFLLDARHAGKPVADLDPALQPATLLEAYAVQDAMAAKLGPVGGWKIGAARPDTVPMYGPMPLHLGFVGMGQQMPDKQSRLRGIEAEIGFLLQKDLPIRGTGGRPDPYSREEILSAIGRVCPVIEVLESAFVAPDEATHLAMVADLQMNGGFVHGPAYADWRSLDFSDIPNEPIEITIDGVVRWDALGKNTNGPDMMRLLEHLVNDAQFRTGGLQAGQWITTGSWMGKLMAHAGSSVEVRFARFGTVAFSFAG